MTGAVRVFARAGERFALPASSVIAVEALDHLTPIPTAPPPLRGLTQVRGQVLPVLDLSSAASPPARGAPLVIVELPAKNGRAALLAEQVGGDPASARALDLAAVATEIRRAIDAQGGLPGRTPGR